MRPQQRTSGLRRVRENIYGAQLPTVDWAFDSVVGFDVYFRIQSPVGVNVPTLDGYRLQGIPQIYDAQNAFMPTAAQIIDPYLVLTYPVSPSGTLKFNLAPTDPAFRGRVGEYLCSKEIVIPVPAPPTNGVVTSGNFSGAVGDFYLSGAGGQLYVQGLPVIMNTTQSDPAIRVSINGGTLQAEFTLPINSADVFDYSATAGSFLNATGGQLDTFNITMP